MEDIHRTHKEPAWGWIGALLDARKPAAQRREQGQACPDAAPPPRRLLSKA